MFLLFSKIRNAHLPIYFSIKLFDQTVLPILTYGTEIFGFENLDTCTCMLESVHNDFFRISLNTRKRTSTKYIARQIVAKVFHFNCS